MGAARAAAAVRRVALCGAPSVPKDRHDERVRQPAGSEALFPSAQPETARHKGGRQRSRLRGELDPGAALRAARLRSLWGNRGAWGRGTAAASRAASPGVQPWPRVEVGAVVPTADGPAGTHSLCLHSSASLQATSSQVFPGIALRVCGSPGPRAARRLCRGT